MAIVHTTLVRFQRHVAPAMSIRSLSKAAIPETSFTGEQLLHIGNENLRALVDRLDRSSDQVDCDAFATLLRKCGSANALEEGRRVHLHIVKSQRYERDTYLGNLLVQMYSNCGSLEEASAAFGKIDRRNLYSWTIMMVAYARNGHLQAANSFFEKMPERNEVSWSAMVSSHAQAGTMEFAKDLFHRMPQPTTASWNAMITANAQTGQNKEALNLFRQMDLDGSLPNKITFISVLDACETLAFGKIIQDDLVGLEFHTDVVVATALMSVFSRFGCVGEARDVFMGMSPQRDLVSWNTMISTYTQNGQGKQALEIFRLMDLEGVQPSNVSFISTLEACTELAEGTMLHGLIVDCGFESEDVVVGTAVVSMYARCKSLENARSMFNRMRERNVVSWNAMITAYAQEGYSKEALELFRMMNLEGFHPNRITLMSISDACASSEHVAHGKLIHASVADSEVMLDVAVGTAFVNMYAKCGNLQDARSTFDKMPQRNVVSWTTMVAAYAQTGHGNGALEVFRMMDLEGVQPTKVTFMIILDACANTQAFRDGKLIHENIVDSGIPVDAALGTALVDLHGKCGDLGEARRIFKRITHKDVISWNAIISAFAQNGHGEEAQKLVHEMGLEGVLPNEITFVSILAACSHAGLLKDGLRLFIALAGDHFIAPCLEHYVCMVDLLSRVGRMAEAEELINNMPFEPGAVAWTIMLGTCKVQGNVERGEQAADQVISLNPEAAATYVALSSIYAKAATHKKKHEVNSSQCK